MVVRAFAWVLVGLTLAAGAAADAAHPPGPASAFLSIRVTAGSAGGRLEVAVAAPNGLVTGHAPSGAPTCDIPQSTFAESPGAQREAGNPPGGDLPESKSIEIQAPVDGAYTIRVYGRTGGAYDIRVEARDASGGFSSDQRTGRARRGSIEAYTVTYASKPGARVTVRPASMATDASHKARDVS